MAAKIEGGELLIRVQKGDDLFISRRLSDVLLTVRALRLAGSYLRQTFQMIRGQF